VQKSDRKQERSSSPQPEARIDPFVLIGSVRISDKQKRVTRVKNFVLRGQHGRFGANHSVAGLFAAGNPFSA
ncbi:MAG TPA: hypothetical protein DCS07_07635, partial [Bdellovibrionales bacterium]|nr:hypothetical protein [Bdellovibrionales bacterium]